MKPGDAFLGVIDFFSTLVPGAVAAFLLLNEYQDLLVRPTNWPLTWGSKEGWAVFVVSAYLLGHAIVAVGSVLDKLIYDRIYVRWKRTEYVGWLDYDAMRKNKHAQNNRWLKPKIAETNKKREQPNKLANAKIAETWTRWRKRWALRLRLRLRIHWKRVKVVARKLDRPHPLLSVAKILKNLQLFDLLQGTGQSSKDVSNAFWWAGSIVRLKSPAGTTEIESLQAQSKMFRSIVVILLAMLLWAPFGSQGRDLFRFSWLWLSFFWVSFFCLSVWRFCRLRWDASERTYEYFIGVALPTDFTAAVARLAYSYWQARGQLDEVARNDWVRAMRELKGR